MCSYGAGCTRADCIYRHPETKRKSVPQSSEPCMAFLAGICTFTADGCRKRHVGKAEAQKLVAKYQSMPCRYGRACKTAGCLFIHPGDGDEVSEEGKESVCAENFPTPTWAQQRQQQQHTSLGFSSWVPNSPRTLEYTPAGTQYSKSTPQTQYPTPQSRAPLETSPLSAAGTNPNAKEFVPGSWKA